MEKLLQIIEQKKAQILELETFLWANPEIEMEEFQAKAKFCQMLQAEGFALEEDIPGLPTAFVAHKGQGPPHIGLMAEYDALPGLGHACGHNLIGAMGFGAAIALAERLQGQSGTVYLLGSPAEETGRGKPGLIECGALEGLDVAMMIHPDYRTYLESPMINLEGYEIVFHGRTSHAASSPEHGVNALDAAVLFANGVGLLRQQMEMDARVHYIITDGGQAPNIIPDRSALKVEIRHPDLAYFRDLVRRVHDVARAAALGSGCTVEMELFEPPISCVRSNPLLVELFHEQLQRGGVPEQEIIKKVEHEGGCTDMGNVSQVLPAIHPMLRMVGRQTVGHTVEFCREAHEPFAQEQALKGVGYLAGVGLRLAEDPSLVEAVWAAFRRQEQA